MYLKLYPKITLCIGYCVERLQSSQSSFVYLVRLLAINRVCDGISLVLCVLVTQLEWGVWFKFTVYNMLGTVGRSVVYNLMNLCWLAELEESLDSLQTLHT